MGSITREANTRDRIDEVAEPPEFEVRCSLCVSVCRCKAKSDEAVWYVHLLIYRYPSSTSIRNIYMSIFELTDAQPSNILIWYVSLILLQSVPPARSVDIS